MENDKDILSCWCSSYKDSAPPLDKFWEDVKAKKVPWLRWEDAKSRQKLHLGPAGAAGIGCGVGVGFGLVGGAGYGAWPWNNLRFVFGIGFGCGVGIGYGIGQGIGVLWDRKHPKVANGKMIVVFKRPPTKTFIEVRERSCIMVSSVATVMGLTPAWLMVIDSKYFHLCL